MEKNAAKNLFGGRQKHIAAALKITKQAVSAWPDVLPPRTQDEVVGAAVRTGVLQLDAASQAKLQQAQAETGAADGGAGC